MNDRLSLLRWFTLLVLGLAIACSGGERTTPQTSGDPVLEIGNRAVTSEEFHRYLKREVGLGPEELEPAEIDRLYDEFLSDVLFALAAEALAISVEPELLSREIRRLEALETGGSIEQLKLEARRTLLARAYEEDVLAAEVRVAEEEIDQALGRAQRSRGRNQMVFRQILVEDKKTANEIYRRLVRENESFEALARELSAGPDQGAVQQVPLGNLPEPAARVLGRLPEGGASRPVLVGKYYYLFQLDARNHDPDPGRVREREMIEHRLFREKLEALRLERLGELARAEGADELFPAAAE